MPDKFAANSCKRRLHIDAKRGGLAGSHPPLPFWRSQMFAGARVKGRAVRVARPAISLCDRIDNVAARTKAWVCHAKRRKPCERPRIVRKMLRLAAHGRFPGKPEPGEVLVNRLFEFEPASLGVDIFDAQQKAPACLARQVVIQ